MYEADNFQVDLLQSFLEKEGIPVLIKRSTLETLYGGFSTVDQTRLYIPQEFLEKAAPVVEEFDRNAFSG